jgi:hypothetical protein
VTGDAWALDATGLRALTERTAGRPEIAVALLDGPVALDHPDLAEARLHPLGAAPAGCPTGGPACAHGTFVAGVLCARLAGARARPRRPAAGRGRRRRRQRTCTCYNGVECTVTPGGWCKCRVPGPYGVTDDLKTQPAEFLTR